MVCLSPSRIARRTAGILCLIASLPSFLSCSEKKETTEIIVEKTEENVSAQPVKMPASADSETIEWLGRQYTCEIVGSAAEDLPTVRDAVDEEYYDNRITLKITRADGSVFFSRVFTKSDFAQYIDAQYLGKSILQGLMFEKVNGDNLQFVACVGDPDTLSDEYIPFIVSLSRTGDISVTKDTRLELEAGDADDD